MVAARSCDELQGVGRSKHRKASKLAERAVAKRLRRASERRRRDAQRHGSRGHGHEDARDGVRHVIVCARRVLDAVPAAARGAALELTELRDEPRMVEQSALPEFSNGRRSR
jgi:hypothetical protein